MDILLHLFVMYSLLLWQSILEIFLDERIAIGVVIGLSIIQIILGNIVYTYEMSEGFNLILYVNLYASLRTDFMRMPMSVMLGAVIIILLLQVLILRRLVIKKDIMQLSSL